jgi:hypothetical protein
MSDLWTRAAPSPSFHPGASGNGRALPRQRQRAPSAKRLCKHGDPPTPARDRIAQWLML